MLLQINMADGSGKTYQLTDIIEGNILQKT